ncbi:MAG: hypothetical protein AAF235_11920 [Planctomycetota bacterium]
MREPLPIGVDWLGRLWDDRGRSAAVTPRRDGSRPWNTLLHERELVMRRGIRAGIFGGLAGALIFLALRAAGEPSYALAGIGVAAAGFGWGAVRLGMLWYPPRWRRETVRRRLAIGLCGACDRFIEDVPRDGFGCVVCPGCGAAWLADRFAIPDTDGW